MSYIIFLDDIQEIDKDVKLPVCDFLERKTAINYEKFVDFWLIIVKKNKLQLPVCYSHSQNLAGQRAIVELIKKYKEKYAPQD